MEKGGWLLNASLVFEQLSRAPSHLPTLTKAQDTLSLYPLYRIPITVTCRPPVAKLKLVFPSRCLRIDLMPIAARLGWE